MSASKLRRSRVDCRVRGTNRQRGFTLPEALIAAAIAAGVTVAAAQSVSTAARSYRVAKNANDVADQAELIAARIDAGMPVDDVLQGMEGWTVTEQRSYPREANTRSSTAAPPLLILTVAHAGAPEIRIQMVRLARQ